MVPEPNHPETFDFQIGSSLFVSAYLQCMLAAVNFNHQLPINADKIANIRPHRVLPPEFKTLQRSITQQVPQFPLGVSLILSQLSGSFWHRIHCLSLALDRN
jgi:hypothetical protein